MTGKRTQGSKAPLQASSGGVIKHQAKAQRARDPTLSQPPASTSRAANKQASKGKAKAGLPASLQAVSQAKGESKQASDFIDDLFSASKKRKDKSGASAAGAPGDADVAASKAVGKPAAAKGKGAVSSVNDLFGKEAEARKQTEEGWNVYSEEELGLNKQGGDTLLCPFDCTCCY